MSLDDTSVGLRGPDLSLGSHLPFTSRKLIWLYFGLLLVFDLFILFKLFVYFVIFMYLFLF